MQDSKKQLEYIENTQTLIGSKRRNIMDVDTGEMMTVDQITKRVYGTKKFLEVLLDGFSYCPRRYG